MIAQVERDRVFCEPRDQVADFAFDEAVAAVFDDMVERSVPSYAEIQRMLAELASQFATEGSNVYDLGCSTGTTLALLRKTLPGKVRLCGIDSSREMLERCEAKFAGAGGPAIELKLADLEDGILIERASVVLLVLTLMFVRPMNRAELVASIARGLHDGGCLLLVEKVLGEGSVLNRLFIGRYIAFKRRMGYSELEIAQKREALENVLIPYRLHENRDLLLGNGFRSVDVFFKWYNFAGFVAIK